MSRSHISFSLFFIFFYFEEIQLLFVPGPSSVTVSYYIALGWLWYRKDVLYCHPSHIQVTHCIAHTACLFHMYVHIFVLFLLSIVCFLLLLLKSWHHNVSFLLLLLFIYYVYTMFVRFLHFMVAALTNLFLFYHLLYRYKYISLFHKMKNNNNNTFLFV